MGMKGLNIKIDEKVYEELRTYSFVQKKPMTVIIREYIESGLEKDKDKLKEKTSEILEASDDAFTEAMKRSFERHDQVYKKLAK